MPLSPTLLPALAAKYRLPLTEKQFRDALHNDGVIEQLRASGSWTDDSAASARGVISFDDLWMFARDYMRSDLDQRTERVRKNARRYEDDAKLLRRAMRVLRQSLDETLSVFPLVTAHEADALQRAADIIDPSSATRAKLMAGGSPQQNITGYADQLEQFAHNLRTKRGRPADPVASRFQEEWAKFAVELIGSRRDDIGELLFPIIVRRRAPDDYSRSRRRKRR